MQNGRKLCTLDIKVLRIGCISEFTALWSYISTLLASLGLVALVVFIHVIVVLVSERPLEVE